MTATQVFTTVVQLLLLWLSISAHEAAHAWVAERCGDSTARLLGRVSLNPLRQLELFGSLLLPGMLLYIGAPVFGWGRLPYWEFRNFRRPYFHSLLVSAAGPAVNLLLAALATVGIAVAAPLLGAEARQAGMMALLVSFMPLDAASAKLAGFPIMFTLVRMATINAYLAVFNLLPVPPLDGGQITLQLLPSGWAEKLATLRPYGLIIGIALATLGVVSVVLAPFYAILSAVINSL
jgi:Zn-dependent protease